jgi:hypothetical protein
MERKMNKADKLLLVGIKHDLANGYRSFKKCYVCHCEKSHSGMTFHHLWYLKGERTYKDFANPLEYYQYLAPLIRDQPERFLYVCNTHHQAITRLHRFAKIKRNRLIKAVRKTR